MTQNSTYLGIGLRYGTCVDFFCELYAHPLLILGLEDSKKVEMSGGFYLVLFDTIFFVYCLFCFQ
jgi:hypothetical protein